MLMLSPLSVSVPKLTAPLIVALEPIKPAASKSEAVNDRSPVPEPSAVVVAAINLSTL